ncbi:PQQ-binding-like beta-propeller repeat protein [Leifsonia sp. F6_8S_P_1B]|uniref:PQQ-binding-like beta-propeller repeat protein n=1 Tax=Leifsonia williamsii TaxID=3035919 RepID=A0ABT8KDD3_9MICO|nr:PQQ-binding-like beta-propeller repeat protein [Leifsonia williamsii]MDN4614324.1 PQQ-binding-like beta-propeller repeat protein [Leifsonia williamsii]
MSTAEFDPTRSAAIRQLLLDTVAEAPRRERRTRFAIIGALTGAALAIAGGTAALALTGVLHFGAPEPGPAPLPTPTQTSTGAPTPTPSPTPTRDARPLRVTTDPIRPHDVTTVATDPGWGIDLPGTDESCEQRTAYDIADGYALFQIGSKVIGDRADDCTLPDDHLALTMVDTHTGTVLWTREWRWESDVPGGTDTHVALLGTTGRALIVSPRSSSGPHDVIDLSTGSTIASAAFGTAGLPAQQVVPVGGDSGDVLVALPPDPGAGFPEARLLRADPRDASHAVWTRSLGLSAWLQSPRYNATGVVPISWRTAEGDAGHFNGVLDVDTGAVVQGAAYDSAWLTENAALRTSQPDPNGTVQLSGIDRAGSALWTDVLPAGSDIREIRTLSARPGSPVGTTVGSDLVAAVSGGGLLVFDALDGRLRWNVALDRCAPATAGQSYPDVFLDEQRNAIVLGYGGGRTCSFDAASGAPAPVPDTPMSADGPMPLRGWSEDYAVPDWTADGTGAAYDRATGARLWQTPTEKQERWYFAGGVLIRERGRHIEPLG